MTANNAILGNTALFSAEHTALKKKYVRIRQQSENICQPLEIEDYGIQTVPETSPPKWHLAHTSWFFETMLLKPFLEDYEIFDSLFSHLFNSYYDTIGTYHPRPERGLLSRPTVAEVYQYRTHIDTQMNKLLNQTDHHERDEIIRRTTLGLNHEQQHQELMLTDIKYNFAYNPLRPVYLEMPPPPTANKQVLQWHTFEGGVKNIGFHVDEFCDNEFSYDNESPRHRVYVDNFRLASRPVTNAEYIEFIDAGAYRDPDLWLSEAWKTIQQNHWQAPLYWEKVDDVWWHMTLTGMCPVDLQAPVCHVSHFEASAYARWAGKRLPSEAEWEIASEGLPITGNFSDQGYLQPVAAQKTQSDQPLLQMYGDVWEWTQSPYTSYPGYQQAHGPLGEYNGKFMSSQMVLRGGSCATSSDHIRPTYRNFFYPHERWQFSGFRLAQELT